MALTPTPRPTDPSRSADTLLDIATLMNRGAAGGPPSLFGVEPNGSDDFRLHVRPCLDPAEDLRCWRAPDSWTILGTSAPARITRMNPLCETPDTAGALGERTLPAGAAMTHALQRDGRSVSVLDFADAESGTEVLEATDPIAGLTADACRLGLGLRTAAPDVPAAVAVVWMWLDEVASAAMRQPGLQERDCWLLHPALALAEPGSPATIAQRCAAATASLDWADLREQAACGEPSSRLGPDVAAWCDDGAYSRLLLTMLPARRDLFDAIKALVPRRVAARLLDAMEDALS